MSDPETTVLLAGTYMPPQGRGEGVSLLEVDVEHGTLRRLALDGGVLNPTFVAFGTTGTAAYATSEIDALEGGQTGALVSLRVQDGTLTATGRVLTGSTEPCHIAIAPDGRHAVVSNYHGGAVTVVALDPDGRVGERTDLVQHRGSSVDPDRQTAAHAHSATFAGGDRVFVCDLGMDRVLVYRLDGEASRLEAVPSLDIVTPPGTGPRHLDFSPDKRHLYVAGELGSSVVAYEHDPATGQTEQLQVASTLGDAVPAERNHPADIHVHPNGRFVYVSNRGLDSLAIFGIDERDGKVELLANHLGGGSNPRSFAIHPAGRLLVCANQSSDNVTPFWIDPTTGLLTQAGAPLPLPSAACLRFQPV